MHRLIKIRIMRDCDRLENRVRRWMDNIWESGAAAACFLPPADFYETTQGLVLRLELAGVAKDDLSLTLCGQELVIRGRRRPSPPEGAIRFLRHEISYGPFERSFLVPVPIDPEGLRAQYADGVLEVYLPRQAPSSRRIPVKETE